MTRRIPLDAMTSDALDALYERLEAAEQTESERQLARAREALASATTRAARAEAAVARVRAVHRPMQRGPFTICAHYSGWDGRRCLGVVTNYPCPTLTALDEPGPVAGGCSAPVPRTEPNNTGPAATEAAEPAWTPPPPGDTREQLPDHILDLIRGSIPDYVSTACVTADTLAVAVHWSHPQRAELGQWAERLHQRCRMNQKFTGQLCVCGCHA